MEAGKLRHRISLERAGAPAPNAYGETAEPVWTAWRECWAAVEPVSGREVVSAKQFAASVSHKVTIRYVAGVLPTDRVKFGARTFAINAVINPEERNVALVLYCTEAA